jgi:hypothetical protein
VALLTSPFTWWIVALAAIAAGLIYAYNHITPFRNAVNAVWDAVRTGGMAAFGWLRDHWPLVLSIITGPFGAALIAIVRNWSKIRGAASDGMRAVINTINGSAGQGTWLEAAPTAGPVAWSTTRWSSWARRPPAIRSM